MLLENGSPVPDHTEKRIYSGELHARAIEAILSAEKMEKHPLPDSGR